MYIDAVCYYFSASTEAAQKLISLKWVARKIVLTDNRGIMKLLLLCGVYCGVDGCVGLNQVWMVNRRVDGVFSCRLPEQAL